MLAPDAPPPLAPRLAPGLVAVVAAGGAAFVLQGLVPRLLAPYVGTTIGAFTTSIAVVMLGSAIGNALGGRWARRRHGVPRALAIALALAAAGVMLVGVVVPPLGRLAFPPAGRASTIGALLAPVLETAAFALPATIALGLVFPLAAAAATRGHPRPGRVLGLLAAAGSAGCVAGLLVTTFALVPAVGTRASLLGAGGLLGAAGVAVTILARRGGVASPSAAVPARAPRAPASWTRGRAAAIAAVAGAGLLIVEVVAARTCGRLTGHGLHAWTAVLLAVLLGATIGGAVGGRIADRGDLRAPLARVALAAAVLTLGAAWTPAFVAALAQASGPWRPARIALGAVLAWSPAAAALAAIPPIALRGALDGRGADADATTIGRVTAWQTLGCLAATVATAPWLVPWLWTGGTLAATACAVACLPRLAGARVEAPLAVALAGAALAAALPFAPAAAVGRALALRPDGDAILVRESAYQQVRVDVPPEYATLGRPRLRRLVLDGFVHSYTDLDDPAWLGYGYEGLYAAVTTRLWPTRPEPVATLSIGGGACTFPRWIARRWPTAAVHVAELDPAVTRVAREQLGLRDDAGVHVVDADGRTYASDASSGRRRWDFVYGDAFSDVAVPWHLTTQAFVAVLGDATSPHGAYLLNVVDATGGGRFLGAVVATLRTAFAAVEIVGLDEPSGGRETFVLVATHAPVDLADLRRPDPRARDGATLAVRRWTPAEIDTLVAGVEGLVLTDDFAPVEWLLAPVAGEIGR